MSAAPPQTTTVQFEVMPFERAQQEAASIPERLRLTVTSSPRQRPEQTIEMAAALAALGHTAIPHLAARAVRDHDHLQTLLDRCTAAGIEELFVIGGDSRAPAGGYSSAGEVLPLIRRRWPGRHVIGIAGYPEGHPLIPDEVLAGALEQKSALADYVVTQMCFDADRVLAWIEDTRERGVALPVYIGLPGVIDRRRLLEVSLRIGVGPSLSFVRKQRGLRQLLRRPALALALDELYGVLAPHVGSGELNIAGFHFFTLNQLADTWSWQRQHHVAVKEARNELSQP
jgi:methylenetetrahydrofolate reductase (NADPH)